ncbi:phospholipase [Microbacterium invictum]|uniref:Phospholipase n=1 Tax=Microbacterium invictum TaxID=515415 RepID=A0AA40SSA4_9MICO|nr:MULTISPECIES: phospholipase [Microbacterium]MBB4141493.1 hypothetical protein [Microbacterium invictum]
MRSRQPEITPARPRRRLFGRALIAVAAGLGVALTGFVSVPVAHADDRPVSALETLATAIVVTADGEDFGPVKLDAIVTDAEDALTAAQEARSSAWTTMTDVRTSGLSLGDEATDVITTDLTAAISELSDLDVTPTYMLPAQTADVLEQTRTVAADTAALREQLTVAQEKKAAEEAAAAAAAEVKRKAEEAERKAEEAAATLAAENTRAGAKAVAQDLAASEYGWGGDQFSCLERLWTRESGWDYQAYNASSGATGIPQSLPGSKMATAGADWQTSARTQIVWGLDYISRAYGTPCAAWGHSQATNWY